MTGGSDRCERGVIVECLVGMWSGRQECENDGGEVSTAH